MTEEKITPRIIKGDKKYRNSLFFVYFLLLSCVFVFCYFIFPSSLQKFRALETQPYFATAETVIIVFLLFFIAPALYLISIGKKIRLHAQFPFPGMKVIRDTKVISGKKAIARANMLIYFGYFACFISITSSISVFCIIHKILNSELLRQLPLF